MSKASFSERNQTGWYVAVGATKSKTGVSEEMPVKSACE